MLQSRSAASRLLVQTALIILALVLAATLTALGLIWLMQGVASLLSQFVGAHWSAILVGALCLTPFIALLVLLFRMRNSNSDESASGGQYGTLRQLVRENPWEMVSAALIFGLTYGNNPEASKMVLTETLATLQQGQSKKQSD